MKTNMINAKKMLMSTLAAVAFSFVFTTSAGASTIDASQYEASKCEIQRLCRRLRLVINEKSEEVDLHFFILRPAGYPQIDLHRLRGRC